MATASWPSTLPQKPLTQTLSNAPLPMTVGFEVESGVPQSRPIISEPIHVLSFDLPAMTQVLAATFRTFMERTIKGGASPFAWRDPRNNEVWTFKPDMKSNLYDETDLGTDQVRFSLNLMRLPNRPWWVSYVLANTLRIPYFVADYQNSIYGINEAKVANTALPGITGTYDIVRTTTGGVVTTVLADVITAGEITTAGTGFRSIIGYPTI